MQPQRLFGKVLRQMRNDLGISQEELAFRAGVDNGFVSRLERGVRQPTLTTILNIAKALRVKPSVLMSRLEKEL